MRIRAELTRRRPINDAALSLARHGKLLYDLQNVSRTVQ